MGRALLVVIVAIGTAFGVFWVLAPRLLASHEGDTKPKDAQATEIGSDSAGGNSSHSSESGGSNRSSSGSSTIAPPLNPDERQYEDVEKQRSPFYSWVRENFNYVASLRPSPEDQSTLEIYSRQDDARISTALVHDVVAPYAKRYGFRRARFYLPNPPGNVDRYRLDSESTPDAAGVWNTFRK